MTRAEFIEALKIQTSDAAVFGTKAKLERPPGRKPRERDLKLSEWYRSLAEADRSMIVEIMRDSAEMAVFGFLCVLDGVAAIEAGQEKGELKLHYLKGNEDLLVNDPASELLHDTYNSLCRDRASNSSR